MVSHDNNREGFAIISRELLADPNVSMRAKMVYLALSARVNHRTHTCWPSHQTIADDCAVSVSTVAAALNDLRDAGAISWQPRTTEQGGATSNLYHLHLGNPLPVGGTPSPESGYPLPKSRVPPSPESGDEPDPYEPDPLNIYIDADASMGVNEKQKTSVKEKSKVDPEFQEWYAHYPRKAARGAAERAWAKLRKAGELPELSVLITAAEAYGRLHRDPTMQKHPATWLNARCWEDDDVQRATRPRPQPMSESDRMRRYAHLQAPYDNRFRPDRLEETIATYERTGHLPQWEPAVPS